jgi:hypothetical protein
MEAQGIPLPSCRNGRVLHIAGASGLALLLSGFLASADDLSGAQSANGSFLSNWFARSDASKEEQPHWITPVVKVTPRLEQEYRYDQTWQSRPKNVDLDNYGGGKGVELKYRAASANEEHGNYIVTGFLGVSVPTGDNVFTNHQTIITPTLAAGKGWGFPGCPSGGATPSRSGGGGLVIPVLVEHCAVITSPPS